MNRIKLACGDNGYTLVELLVTMVIFGSMIAVMTKVAIGMSVTTATIARNSDQVAELRAAGALWERQIRSADAINRPVRAGSTGRDWFVELLSDIDGQRTCTQWVLRTATGSLAVRRWTQVTGQTSLPSGWRTVVTNVVDRPSQLPFTFVAATPGSPHQRLTLDLKVRGKQASSDAAVVSTSARNTDLQTQTNPDIDSDGMSDVQVCLDLTPPRS